MTPNKHAKTQRWALHGLRLIDGTGRPARDNQMVVVANGLIEAVASDPGMDVAEANNLWLHGKIMIPGLIDMHAHLLTGGFDSIVNASASYDRDIQERVLNQMLYWGVTGCHYSVQPVDNGLALRASLADGSIKGPRLWIAGPGVTAPNGWAGSNDPSARLELDDENAVAPAIAALADRGIDFVKVFYDDMCCAFHAAMPKLKRPVMEKVIAEAHRHSLPVSVHVYELNGHFDILAAGGDILYHSAVTGPIDQRYLDKAHAMGAAYVATLSIYNDTYNPEAVRAWAAQACVQESVARKTLATLAPGGPLDDFESFTRRENMAGHLPTIMQNVARIAESGLRFAVGPDTGVPGVFPGLSVHREMALMAQAGIPPLQILKAATSNAAEILGASDIGAIMVGKSADFLLLDDDPSINIEATRSIASVWQKGQEVDRSALLDRVLSVDKAN